MSKFLLSTCTHSVDSGKALGGCNPSEMYNCAEDKRTWDIEAYKTIILLLLQFFMNIAAVLFEHLLGLNGNALSILQ